MDRIQLGVIGPAAFVQACEAAAQEAAAFSVGGTDAEAMLIGASAAETMAQAEKALGEGKHVLCTADGLSAQQCRALADTAQAKGKVFGLIDSLRTRGIYRRLHGMAQNGEMGAKVRLSWVAPGGSARWAAADLLVWVAGMPARVQVIGKGDEAGRGMTAYLEYEDGATGVYITGADAMRLELDCDMGKLVCEEDALTLSRNEIGARSFSLSATDGFAKPLCTESVVEKEEMPQLAETLSAFALAVREGTLVDTPAEGYADALRLLAAFDLSAQAQRVVDMAADFAE